MFEVYCIMNKNNIKYMIIMCNKSEKDGIYYIDDKIVFEQYFPKIQPIVIM